VTALFEVALPFFALILCGYMALARGLVSETAVAGLNGFVFYFALPALLFLKVATSPLDDLFDWRFFIAFYGVAGVLWLSAIALFRWWFGLPFAEASVAGMGGIWTNSGYMGIPLLITALGPEAALPAVLALTFDNLITAPILIMILEARAGRAASRLATLRTVATNLARNPLIIAVFGGFAWNVSGFDLPTPIANFTDLLGAAAAPCALFALGASLVGAQLAGARAEIATATAIKLLVHPLLMALTVLWLLPLRSDLAIATIVTASLPTGASVFVLAERYATYTRRASSIVLVTHALSVVTVTAVLVWARG
jgi:malonate transporter and related proteins